MNAVILVAFIILMIMVQIAIKRNTKIEKNTEQEFWEREREANFARKKPIDGLDYITIPAPILNIENTTNNEDIANCKDTLSALSDKKILNLTGLSNTDLKLAYGAANFQLLSEYDANYELLCTTLQSLAEALCEEGRSKEAMEILEYAIETGSDISKTFFLLADLYNENQTPENIQLLIAKAKETHTLMKDAIISNLESRRLG